MAINGRFSRLLRHGGHAYPVIFADSEKRCGESSRHHLWGILNFLGFDEVLTCGIPLWVLQKFADRASKGSMLVNGGHSISMSVGKGAEAFGRAPCPVD